MSNFDLQKTKFRTQPGFIAALDQSGGSTPKALKLYGVDESAYSGETQMMDRIHEMRTRIITSPSFNGDRILAAILFEATMDRAIEGVGSAEYLWKAKRVVPAPQDRQGPGSRAGRRSIDESDAAASMPCSPKAGTKASSVPRSAPSSSGPARRAYKRSSTSNFRSPGR